MVLHKKQKHIKELNIAIYGAKIDHVESFNLDTWMKTYLGTIM